MRSGTTLSRAIIAGLLLSLAIAATVVGYAGQVAATVTVSGPSGPQACGTPITVSALIQETGGGLIEGQSVAWAWVSGNVTGDTILTATSITNASGVATTRVQFACSPHGVVLGATADDVTGTTNIAVSGEGLPRTDIAPTPSSLGMLLAALAVLVGSGMILRRFALARR